MNSVLENYHKTTVQSPGLILVKEESKPPTNQKIIRLKSGVLVNAYEANTWQDETGGWRVVASLQDSRLSQINNKGQRCSTATSALRVIPPCDGCLNTHERC